MAKRRQLTRREFVKKSAAAVTLPAIVPASALGRGRQVPPSERIQLGVIGPGGRGTHVLREMMREPDVRCVAVCDVRRDRRESAKALVDRTNGSSDCAAYRDLRELLARSELDAVLIAISDRWHTAASVMAMNAGKDVFCEKPVSVSVEQSRILADRARQTKRIFQAGTQRRSEEPFVFAVQLARSGKIGKLHTIVGHIMHGFAKPQSLPAEPEPPREELDWDLYLGPVPQRPYNRKYVENRMIDPDFWAGGIAEWGSHTFDLCQWANDSVETGPVEYIFPNNETSDGLIARYANGVQLKMTGGHFPGSCGARFEGSEGWAECSDGPQLKVSPDSLLGERKRLVDEYREKSGRSLGHNRDFINCVKSRKQPTANADVARQAHNITHVASMCMALRRNLRWDPKKEQFVGDAEADRLRSKPMRAPYAPQSGTRAG